MKHFYTVLFSVLFISSAFAQQPKHAQTAPAEECKSDARHHYLMDNDAAYRAQFEANQLVIQNMLQSNLNYVRNGAGVLTVPIVVHVIHTGQNVGSGANISDAQIQSAIDAANDDYRKVAGTQGDGGGVDTEIEFCLATMDPNGNATNGINRVDGSSTTSGGDNYGSMGITDNNEVAVKNLSKWPNTDYYNIWIVTEIDNNNGGSGTQGYAYFPGASATYDGAVILYNAFGYDPNGTNGYNLKSYTNRNRTLTHEMGHAFNLYHTFEGDANGTTCPPNNNCATDGDQVCDTDPHIRSASNCPTGTNSCSGNPNQDIVRNYMDYSSDVCMDEFTQNQTDRMRAALCGTRASLLTSSGCSQVTYCVPTSTQGTSDGDFVDGVVLGNINNTGSGATSGPDYNDYTAQSTSLLAGASYSISVTGGDYAGDTYGVWIDYNSDNDFVDTDEFLGEFTTSGTYETQAILFTVPSSVTNASTRLRVRGVWSNGATPDPCQNYNYGETEDYTVDLISYCVPNPSNGTNDGDFIDGVVLGSISNTGSGSSSGPNYTDYTALSTSINTNSTYNLAVTGGQYQPDYYAAWIDYNQDGDFDDSNEKLGEFQSNAAFQTQQISFTVPSAATAGATRLRVRCVYNTSGNINPCTNYTYGETEDYTVDVSTVNCGTIIAVATASDPTCGNSDGSITVNPTGGTSPYTYSWNTGATSGTVSSLGAGTYTVNITDSDGCPGSGTFTLTDAGAPTASVSSSNTTCHGGADGTASVSASGGSSPYTYQWSSGSTSAIASGLAAGSYTVTVEGSNGCSIVQSTTINSPSAINVSVSTSNASCGQADGSATASASGGSGGFNYLWDGNADSQATATATGLASGSYDVTATDNQGCTQTATVSVSSAGGPTATPSSGNIDCFGNANGTASISAAGGTTPYTYLWSTGSTQTLITNLAAGSYTVTVSDAGNCSDVETIVISQPNAIGFSPTFTLADCGMSNGAITAGATGGTPSFAYTWSNGSTSNTISGLAAGTYSVTATDINGCVADTSYLLGTNPGSGGPSLTPSANDATCFGANDGSAAIVASGGTTPYTYQWSNGTSSAILLNLAAGTYTCTVSDVTGCSNISVVTISQPAALDLTFSVVQPSCGNADGEIAASMSGGSAPYFYFWPDGQTSATAINLTAGIYYVTVQDSEGCELELPIALNNDPTSGGPTVIATVNDASCPGETDGSAAITVSNGTAPYSYQWGDGATTPIRLDIAPGTYNYTVTDANGCITADSISVGSPPAPDITTSTSVATCGLSDGSATVVASGGAPPFIYFWDASTGSQTGQTATGLAAGTYNVTVSDNNSCETEVAVAVSNLNAPSVVVSGNDISCFGGNEGLVNLTLSGGTAPFDYNWSNGTTGQNLIGVTAGTYTVTVTDAQNCIVVLQAEVSQPAAPLTISSTSQNTSGTSDCDGQASASAFGGTTPYSYAWNDPASSTQAIVLDMCAGDYTVTVTDANGCTETEEVTVNVGVGVQELRAPMQVRTWPNPTTGNLLANIAGGTGTIEVRVFNSTGQLVHNPHRVQAGSGVEIANLHGLAEGLYVVEIRSGSERTLHRIQLLK